MFHLQKRGVINYPFDIGPKSLFSPFEHCLSQFRAVRDSDGLGLKYVGQGPRNPHRLPS